MGQTVPYVVRSGDYLRSIALAHGLEPEDIWEDDANASLRKQRTDPDQLAPGDVLFLPVVERNWLSVEVGSRNTFSAVVPTVRVSLKVTQDDSGQNALSGLSYTVHGLLGGDLQGTVPEDGSIAFDAPVGVLVTLEIPDLQVTYPVLVGGMDPIETQSGVRFRLAHLGYLDDHAGDHPLDVALAAFQRQQGIEVTGRLDDATASALVKAHGS